MDMLITASVSSREFVRAMTTHWTTTLGNVSSPSLEALWGIMADTFNNAAMASQTFQPDNTWRVLEPPTGSGKTQGLCVYASLAMQRNVNAAKPLGILIVTRLIEQAHEIVDAVTAHVADMAPGRTIVAKHSNATTTTAEAKSADVLVITHEAYTRALEQNRWEDFTDWSHGRRSLTVIDEALAGVITTQKISTADVRQTLSYLTQPEKQQFAVEVAALSRVEELLEEIGSSSKDGATGPTRMSMVIPDDDGAAPSMDALRAFMAPKKFDWLKDRTFNPVVCADAAQRVDDTLKSCEALLSSWAYYHNHWRDGHTFNSADLIIPPHLPGPVVLDATARQNFLWTLLEARAARVVVPARTRSYANVTLHVARTSSGLGKYTMNKQAAVRLPRLVESIKEAHGTDHKVLLVCHAAIAGRAKTHLQGFSASDVAWYGNIDGRNSWSDYDTVVIFGLHNMPTTWSRNAFMALQGPQGDDWLNNPAPWKEYDDVRREMERRQLTVSIVQAANRVRCRRTIDAEGNCLPTDVFVVLNSGHDGDDVLANLVEEMPGVVEIPWSFEPDGVPVWVPRGSCHEALVISMQVRGSGSISLAQVQGDLGLTTRALRDLKEVLRDPDHGLTKSLADIGVHYQVVGRGRGAKSYLVKT